LILGPQQTGKTCIANFLASHQEQPPSEYKETVACRILEYEVDGLNFNRQVGARSFGGSAKGSVELWDISGNHRYQSCWPAIQKDADGLIFVLNPELRAQEKEVEQWYKNFTGSTGIKDVCCLIMAHRKDPSAPKADKPKLTRALQKLKVIETVIEQNTESFRTEIDRFIETLVIARRTAEEQATLDQLDAEGRGVQGKTTVNYNMATELR